MKNNKPNLECVVCVLFSYFFSFEHHKFLVSLYLIVSVTRLLICLSFFLFLSILSEFCIGASKQCINANSTLCVFVHVVMCMLVQVIKRITHRVSKYIEFCHISYIAHTCIYCSVMHTDWIEVVREKRTQRRF